MLAQLGLLPDADDGVSLRYPFTITLVGHRFTVDCGSQVAAQLDRTVDGARVAYVGMDCAPLTSTGAIIAIRIDNPSPSRRAATLQTLGYLAAILARVADGSALYWPPAALWSSTAELARAVIVMEERGLPPVLHFVAFAGGDGPDHDSHHVDSVGLSWIVGQELSVIGPLTLTHNDLLKRCARMTVDAMVNGPFSAGTQIDGIDQGETMVLTVADVDGRPQVVVARIQ